MQFYMNTHAFKPLYALSGLRTSTVCLDSTPSQVVHAHSLLRKKKKAITSAFCQGYCNVYGRRHWLSLLLLKKI